MKNNSLKNIFNISHNITFLLFGIFTIILFGCNNDLDNMLDDYNARYPIMNYEPQPGEPGFDMTSLLQEKYTLTQQSTLNIFVPKADSYSWVLYRQNLPSIEQTAVGPVKIPAEPEREKITLRQGIANNTNSFYLTVNDVNNYLELGITYILRLEIKVNNSVYWDEAVILLYDPNHNG